MRTLIQKLDSQNRLFIPSMLMVSFGFTLTVLRFFISGNTGFVFLNWNLFLAFVPWITIELTRKRALVSKWVIFLVIPCWLIFFPNAPYIITDFYHLRYNTQLIAWFDLGLIMFFAWMGLLFGLDSLRSVEHILSKWYHKWQVNLLIVIFVFLSSFGMFLGRFLRWNSWNIINEPYYLLQDILQRLIMPMNYPRTWGFSFMMTLVLLTIYYSFKLLANTWSNERRLYHYKTE